jgi:hypothetical protein
MPKYSSPSHTPSKLPTTGLEPDNAAVEVESPLSKETPSDPKPPLEKDSSESSFSPSNNPFKPPATTSEPDNAAVEVDPPLSSRKNSPDPQIPLAEHSEAAASPAYETTPMPWVYPHRKESVIAHNIRNILRTSFDHGYIYILEAPKFFETYKPASINGEVWIKIGISSDVETRVKNLESTCGIPQLSTAYVSSRQYRTLSLKRIERLCQEELNNFRRRLDCGVRSVKCSTMHREWFAVDYKVAERTVERWTQFLDQIPYAEDGRITNHWHDMIERMHGNLKAIDGNKYHGLGDGLDTWFEEST